MVAMSFKKKLFLKKILLVFCGFLAASLLGILIMGFGMYGAGLWYRAHFWVMINAMIVVLCLVIWLEMKIHV